MSTTTGEDGIVPDFVSTCADPSLIYFHHHVDVRRKCLRVEVLGPNLSIDLRHRRVWKQCNPSSITKTLKNRTIGYLTLVAPPSSPPPHDSLTHNGNGPRPKRIVLAWAQSGHGLGQHGDVMDPTPGILSNTMWTEKTALVGRLLGVNLNSFMDGRIMALAGPSAAGSFQASHVEVKLAIHAVVVLLDMFGIAPQGRVTDVAQLHRLRRVRWQGGGRPAFEIYFSRKNCSRCALLVRRLVEATGVEIKLLWKDRLDRRVYKPARAGPAGPRGALGAGAASAAAQALLEKAQEECQADLAEDLGDDEDEAMVISDNDDDDDDDEPRHIETIDLTSDSSRRGMTHPADDRISGLAYCIGQFDVNPNAARRALFDFAQLVTDSRAAATTSDSELIPTTALQDYPTTPVRDTCRAKSATPGVIDLATPPLTDSPTQRGKRPGTGILRGSVAATTPSA